MRDVLVVLAIFAGIIWGLFALGLPYWAGFVITLAVILAFWEFWTRHKSGRTLSQRMWALRGSNPLVFWFVWGTMSTAFVFLMVHLAWKAI